MNKFESAEDYLERILMLKEKNGHVRAIDIVNDMNYSKASVSIALKKLREKNFITVNEKGLISLTDSGYDIASKIYHRHQILTKALILIGVDKDTAATDACKLEHNMSEETFSKIEAYVNK